MIGMTEKSMQLMNLIDQFLLEQYLRMRYLVNLRLYVFSLSLVSFYLFIFFAQIFAGNHSNMGAATRRSCLGWYIGYIGGYCIQ